MLDRAGGLRHAACGFGAVVERLVLPVVRTPVGTPVGWW
jgi:hypothetical protein